MSDVMCAVYANMQESRGFCGLCFLIKVIFAKHINVAIDTVKAASIKFDEEKM